MNKKLNTFLFIVVATVFNIVITVLFCLLLLFVCGRFIVPVFPGFQEWFFPLSFILAIVLSFIVYRLIVRFLMEKVDLEKYFEPIFFSKKRKG